MSLRDDILAVSDLPLKEVCVSEWGGITVWLATLSGVDRAAVVGENAKAKPGAGQLHAATAFLVRVLCDEAGVRLFEGKAGVELLNAKSAAVTDWLVKEALIHNGMDADAVDSAEKN